MKLLLIFSFASVLAMAMRSPSNSPGDSNKNKNNISLQEERWNSAVIKTSKQSEVRWVARKIQRNKSRYQKIERETGVPWQIVGCLHNMECGLSFDKHLHNGDPLTARTWQVPKGMPKTGAPPFTFEYSAVDALRYDRLDKVNWDNLTVSLNAVEGYNGWGYKKHGVPSPYLYSATNIYISGKYIRDHVWSASAISKQIGVVAVLKELGFDWRG